MLIVAFSQSMPSDGPASSKVSLSSLTKVVSSLILALRAMIWAWWRGEIWGWYGTGQGSLKGGGSNTACWGRWLTSSSSRWGSGRIWVCVERCTGGGGINPPPLAIRVIYLGVKECPGWTTVVQGTVKWRTNGCLLRYCLSVRNWRFSVLFFYRLLCTIFSVEGHETWHRGPHVT